nr:DUF5074 domain-containing protein [Pedobacter panaciterrae]
MNNINFKKTLLLAVLAGTLFSCKKDSNNEIQQPESGKFEDGFFVINEGWFGHGTGSVSFFDAASGKLKDSVFQKENPGKDFEPKSSTVQFATLFNKNLYVVSKVGGPVVVADAKSLKEVGRIPASSQNDWRAFVGLDESNGLLSSNKGIFKVNLKTYEAPVQLAGTSGQTGDMLKAGKYVYTLSQADGAVIYNAADLTVAKKIKGVTLGFAQTPNNKVWYTKGKFLYNSDPLTLVTDSVELPFTPSTTWFTWFSSPIIASSKENTVFLLKSPSFGGGKMLYKYIEGNKASLDQPFITTPDKQSFYKKNLGYYAKTNQIVTTTVQDGYGNNYAVNNIYFYDATSGNLVKQIPYEGFYFPAMFVFH